MNTRPVRIAALAALGGLGSILFQSCPIGALIDNCFSENSISASEYDDMNDFEQALYDRNDCGRYERHDDLGFLDDVF